MEAEHCDISPPEEGVKKRQVGGNTEQHQEHQERDRPQKRLLPSCSYNDVRKIYNGVRTKFQIHSLRLVAVTLCIALLSFCLVIYDHMVIADL